jgi:ABC-type Fe3+/spermidine/putrescine transport system ATPase subunit
MNVPQLLFRNVTFRRGTFSLEADIAFPRGRMTVVLGPSGCGKSTLLDLAAGFLHPASGEILDGGTDVSSLPPEKRRVGVVFQDHALFPHLSVRDNVAFGPRVRGAQRRDARRIADKYLGIFHLVHLARRKPGSLSGGERQRVSLARAMAIQPEILLLDEPFSSLDAALRKTLREEVRRIQKETGITAILVTHDQDEALAMADYLAVMGNGRIVQQGDPLDIWKNPADLFTAIFLGRSTRLSAIKLERDMDGCTAVVTAAGKIRLGAGHPVVNLPATLISRPENVRIVAGGPLKGVVSAVEFSDGTWRIRLATPDSDDLFDCNCHETKPPAEGEILNLDIIPGTARLLPGTIRGL